MKNKPRAYLIDTRSITTDQLEEIMEFMRRYDVMCEPLRKDPHIFLAIATGSPDKFASIPFPDGCKITDVTNHKLMDYG